MTDVPPVHQLPPAGWYPDPAGTEQERWWGGVDWTDHLQPVVAPNALPPSAYENPFASEQSVETPAEPVVYQPMGGWAESATYATVAVPYRSGSPNTVPIWLLAFSTPILTISVVALVLIFRDFDTLEPILIGSAIALFCMGVAAIFWDNAILTRRGLRAASPVWMLLGLLAYFIARTVVLGMGGVRHLGPGIVLLGVQSSLFVIGNVASAFTEVQSESIDQVEQAIEDQLALELPQSWQVTCPPDASTMIRGTSFVCEGVGADNTTVRVLVTVQPDGELLLDPAQ